jgi:tRNA(Ile)-lysidine synthase
VHARAGDRVLVAVSGGPDSVALAHTLIRLGPALGLAVGVACVDHQLRPGSGAEAERVVAWATGLGAWAATVAVQVEREGGREGAARTARYAALESLAGAHGFHWVLTGHTASDQAETVLLRLGRGAGLRGARGILARRGRVLRPLLGLSRADVLAYLRAVGQPPLVRDPSNDDLSLARNRVRQRVLPELAQALGPGVERSLAHFAALAADDEALLEQLSLEVPHPAPLPVLQALARPLRRRWLARALAAAGHAPTGAELEAADAYLLSHGTGALELGHCVTLWLERGWVRAAPVAALAEATPVHLALGAWVAVPWAGLEVGLHPDDGAAPDARQLRLPPGVAGPLQVRPRAPGDRFWPLGGVETSLKKLLAAAHIPLERRPQHPVLVDAPGNILWVIGVRVSERCRLTGKGAGGLRVAIRAPT